MKLKDLPLKETMLYLDDSHMFRVPTDMALKELSDAYPRQDFIEAIQVLHEMGLVQILNYHEMWFADKEKTAIRLTAEGYIKMARFQKYRDEYNSDMWEIPVDLS